MGTSEGARKGWTEESRQKRAEAMRRRWQDPEYRARRVILEQTPEMKAARSAGGAKANADPAKRQEHSERMKEKWAMDENFRERQSEGLRKLMEDPAQRKSRSESMLKAWQESPDVFEGSIRAFQEESHSENGRARRKNIGARRAAASPLTPHEHAVVLALNELEVPYFVHKVIEGNEYDIIVPAHSLNIEVDGSNHLGATGREKDSARDLLTEERGYTVLRLPHSEIKSGVFIAKLRGALGLS